MAATQADALVLFGATGDLARRSLLPSLYFLDADGFLPAGFRIVATARAEMSAEAFLGHARAAAEDKGTVDDAVWSRFAGRIAYVAADATSREGAQALGRDHAAEAHGTIANDRHPLAGTDACGDRGMVPGAHHVGEAQK